ncbi:MAG: hypothetical protein AB7U35_03760 [Sphingobium sp.]
MPPADARRVALCPVADAWLDGGLRADGLHEAYAAGTEDSVAATAFVLLLAWRKRTADGRPILWVRQARGQAGPAVPYGPGLAGLGVDPGAVALLLLPDAKAVLRAALDGVRAGAASAVLIELTGRQPLLDLTASRRLALAAAETGTMALVARAGAEPVPSAAHTRWRVESAPSRALEADAPGHPAFALTMLRQRGGRDGLQLMLEWDNEKGSFRDRDVVVDDGAAGAIAAPLLRSQPAMAGGGTAGSGASRAA